MLYFHLTRDTYSYCEWRSLTFPWGRASVQSQQPPHHHWLIHHSSDGHCRTEYSLMLSKLDSNVNFGQLVYFLTKFIIQCMYSVQFSLSAASNSLWPHALQHARPPCPSPTPGARSNSCPSSQWWHPTISSSVIPFSSCPQFLPASGSFLMSQFFTSGGQSIRASPSASVLPMNTQD